MALDAESQNDDDVLLARYARGDAAAARLLGIRFTPRIYAHAHRVLQDGTEAEDVTQEAMMRLWKIAPKWHSGQAQISTWLYRVTANLCTDRLRKRRTVALDDVSEPLDLTPGVEAKLQSQARTRALYQALAQLPDRQRQAVILRHIDGMGNPEIAQILAISIEAVESLTARGKRSLTQGLAEKRVELGYEDDTE